MAQVELTEREIALLDYERSVENRGPFAKSADIRMKFGVPAARYYQELHALLEKPAALAYDPQLVKRLIRLRDARTEARASRTFSTRAA